MADCDLSGVPPRNPQEFIESAGNVPQAPGATPGNLQSGSGQQHPTCKKTMFHQFLELTGPKETRQPNFENCFCKLVNVLDAFLHGLFH